MRRDVTEQAGPIDVLGNVFRPGVARWGWAILPLLEGQLGLGVPSVTALPMQGGVRGGSRGDRIAVPGQPRLRPVSGHTTGHAAFDFEGEGVLLVGDALATRHATSPIRGPQLLPTMFHRDAETARASLAGLRSSSAGVVLPGHGEAWIGPAAAAADAALANGWPW